MNTLVKFVLFLALLFLGMAITAFYWTFWTPLPNYESSSEHIALTNTVDIFWDDFGVPHIYSTNESDLYYAMGYVHAQDRLWQMTLSQLAMEGRFAEFFGENLVPLDQYQRTLGFWYTAKKIEQQLSDKEKIILEAYSKGVNTFIQTHSDRLPVEFALTEMPPISWTITHSIGLTRLMAWDLNMSWWSELMYQDLSQKLPPDDLNAIMVAWSDDLPTTLSNQESQSLLGLLDLEWQRRNLMEVGGSAVGSNAWVIDGSKTTTGYPILAGDPHLGLDMPGKWYEVHAHLNGRNVSGVSLAGLPGIVLGQNDDLAWSFTNIMADDTDFYLEIVNPKDRGQYRRDTPEGLAYLPFDVRRERIKIKDASDQFFDIRSTVHGPVISDIYPTDAIVNNQVISMRWTGHEISHEIKSMYGINWSANIKSFQNALKDYGTPGQNIMYADNSGNIAMFSAAKLPIRKHNPLHLRPGWDKDYDWQSWIPFEELPSIINPKKGWIANANNKITTDAYPHYIASFWEPPSRILRIEELITADSLFSMDKVAEHQTDVFSHFASSLTPTIVNYIESQQEYDFSIVLSYLKNWDYNYTKNSTAASIFDVFFLRFTENTLLDEFGDDSFRHFIRHELIPVRVMPYLIETKSGLFDNLLTNEVETIEDILLKSMQETIYYLSDLYGSEPFEWRWEQLHTIRFSPPLFKEASQDSSAPKALKLVVDNILSHGPFQVPGHGMSINNGQYKWDNPFEMVLGASVRRIVNLADLRFSQSILPTGQSGNPFSSHFGDQTSLWLEGRYKELVQDSSYVKLSNWRHMQLIPVQ